MELLSTLQAAILPFFPIIPFSSFILPFFLFLRSLKGSASTCGFVVLRAIVALSFEFQPLVRNTVGALTSSLASPGCCHLISQPVHSFGSK